MRTTISLNEEARTAYDKGDITVKYQSTQALIEEFESRGHEVRLVHPHQFSYGPRGEVIADHYAMTPSRLELVEPSTPVSGDVFFVRGLSQDHPEAFPDFVSALYGINNQVGFMINGPESTAYEDKSFQRTLDLPFIPQFEIHSPAELSDLVASGEKVIAKPKVGMMGVGILYLDRNSPENIIPKGLVDNFVYEQFIDVPFERRFVFLDGQIVARRGMKRTGNPGAEGFGERWNIQERTHWEDGVVRDAIDQTGMVYGCVDFRGDYVLEVNGSGTSTGSSNVDGTKLYSVVSDIVGLAEKKAR